jgi:predicted transposase/invertase (TIGR01784 family)
MVGKLRVTNDFIFSSIFGKKGNEEILKNLVEAIIKENIQSLEIIDNTKLEKKMKEDKLGILDIKAILSNGTKVNIEMQMVNKHDIVERTLFYWAKLYVEGVKEGENYKDLPKTITINILNYNFLPDNEYHLISHLYYDKVRETMLTDKLEVHFIDLAKFRHTITNVGDDLTAWLSFIDGSREEMVHMAKDNVEAIEQAHKLLEILEEDKDALRVYELRQKYLMDSASEKATALAEGHAEGLAEGRTKGLEEGLEEGLKKGREER